MKRLRILAVAALSALMLTGTLQTASAQEVDRTKYPDYAPFDASKQKLMPQKKSRGAAKAMNRGPRPDHINNALSMYFPPIFNQSGGSCGSAQAIGYMFTHEMNSWRNKDASFEENQYPSHFTWLFTKTGVPKIDEMVHNGIPNVTTYGGRTYSRVFGYQTPDSKDFGWMQGYDKWYSAMFNRSKEFFYGPRISREDDEAREQLKQWLWNRWGTEGYNDGGVAGFGMASGGYWGKIPSTPTNDALGVTNMSCVKAWGHTYDHGMTICGYDDRIEFDLDSNGVIGEKDKDEVGAWIICNSWGDWENHGFIYCPYKNSYARLIGEKTPDMQWATELYVHRQDFVPMRTIKLLMDYSHRWELSLSAGISADTSATKPDATTDFVHFTAATCYDENGESPEVPMLGRWADGVHREPMEFGYDLTDLNSRFDGSKPLKYFFYAKTRVGAKGSGHLYKASILNYELDRENPIEVPFKIDTIEISGSEALVCVSVVVPGEAVNAPLNAALNGNTLTWSSPEPTTLPISKYYIYSAGVKVDSVSTTKKTYSVSDPDANYTVAAVYKYKNTQLVSEHSNVASNPNVIEKGQNKVLSLAGNTVVIPNAITKRLNQGTIEFMVKPTALNGTSNKMGDESGDFFINISASGQVTSGWSTKTTSDYTSTAASSIKLNKWYHVAVTVNGSELTIYIDGMKKKSFVSQNNSGIPAIGDFVIGLDGGEMNACIDEFRVWKSVRTQAEIYAGKDDVISNPAPLSDLLVYMPMDLIEHEGEVKVREYVLTNHAYFDNENYTQQVDETILKGSKLTTQLAITSEKDTLVAGTPVKFAATCPISTTAWSWVTPGAESESYSSQAPYITYGKAGTYNIELTITKADGTTSSVSKEIVVTPAALPVVDFDIAEASKSSGEVFSFINRSYGEGTSYVWTMAGSQQSRVQTTNATAVYDIPGTYTVTLTGTNSSGSVSVSKEVNVFAAAPTPKFNVNPTSIMLGETTYLVDESRGDVENWYWTIDNQKHPIIVNGQNSSLTPTHPGIYDVSLAVSNEVGQNTLTEKKLLYVSNADAKNALSFTGSERVVFDCPIAENSKAWTIDWWMNPSQYSGAGGFYTDNGFARMCAVAEGAYKINLAGSSITSNKGYVILNEWHHYAISYSYGTIKFYRDGEVWESPSNKITYTAGKWTGKMAIGDAETPFKGLIDELRMWDKAVSANDIKSNSNAPIQEPTETNNLALYYNFNQGQGNVKDQTAAANDGIREGFGPDGDAWPLAVGVFTLDLEGAVGGYEDVTDQYLTNYKVPFLYDETKPVSEAYKTQVFTLEQGTENSGWVLRNTYTNPDNGTVTGVHVDKQYNYAFCVASSYKGFNGEVSNHIAYQPVTLPAGRYKFNHESTSTVYFDMKNTMSFACVGSDGPNVGNMGSCLAYKDIADGKEIEFLIGGDTEVSLGMIYNFATYDRYNITQFNLLRQNIEVQQADGETSVYESIRNGNANEAYGREGGIMVASETKKNFTVYTTDGKCVFNDDVHGVHFLPFEKGIYIVNGQKVMVK